MKIIKTAAMAALLSSALVPPPLIAPAIAAAPTQTDMEAVCAQYAGPGLLVETVATGSAAGTVGGYLARAGRVALNQPFVLRQGRFTGRPSQIQVEPRGSGVKTDRVLVGGHVSMVATGTLRNLPRR